MVVRTAECTATKPEVDERGYVFAHRCELPYGHTGPHECGVCDETWGRPPMARS